MTKKAISMMVLPIIVVSAVFLFTISAQAGTAKSQYTTGHSLFHSLIRDESKAMQRRNWEQAAQTFLRCIELNPKGAFAPKALYYLGRVYEEIGIRMGAQSAFIRALEYYGQVAEHYPRHGWADDSLYRRADLYSRHLGEKKRARAEYERIIMNYPKSEKKAASIAAINGMNGLNAPPAKEIHQVYVDEVKESETFREDRLGMLTGRTVEEKPSPVDLYAALTKSVYMIIAIDDSNMYSQGSAVAITAQIMLSNHHVIRGMDAFGYFEDDEATVLRAVNGSRKKDILVAKSTKKLTPVRGFRPYDSLKIGEKIYALGSPQSMSNTFSEGIISGLRELKGLKYIQISAPISHGSSGGGLFDEYGRLIGITTSILKGGQNLNLAISVDEFLPYLSKYLD